MSSDTYNLVLPEIFQLTVIEGLHKNLSEQQASIINIDGSNVVKVDSAGLQLLVSLKKNLDQAAGEFRLQETSAALSAAIKSSGLSQVLISKTD